MQIAQPVGIDAVLRFFQQGRAFRIGGQNRFERRGIPARRFLGDIAEARALGHVHRSVIGIELADQHFHQCRFAGAVAPDQADPAAGRD